ncbi:MAG TPA: SPOR domain-containing protein [Novosphingobium sp.]|nr:SPOR domain-containing protein [Novosphingobium sp.]
MKLPDDRNVIRLSLMTALAGVSAVATDPSLAHSRLPAAPAVVRASVASGPAADYPVVVGSPYAVAGVQFTPVNTMNYDAVGLASVAGEGAAAGISAAHHTLPLPSYVEVTALNSGRTILVRVERRGPADATHVIELSPGAARQLGLADNGSAAVRVRRVNPPESERALLRAGQSAPERMATPKPLLTVLMRRLQADPAASKGGASLARAGGQTPPDDEGATPPAAAKAPPVAPVAQPAPVPAKPAVAAKVTAAPLVAVRAPAKPVHKPAQDKPASPRHDTPREESAKPASTAPAAHDGAFSVQLGAFGQKAHAETIAQKAGGQVSPAGKLWRVRLGPFASRVQAEAALAKAKAAGYSDARIQHAEEAPR